MVIVDEKAMLPPPPSYTQQARQRELDARAPPPPFTAGTPRPAPRLGTLPPHLLLLIVHHTFPQRPNVDEGRVERQRKTLYWLAMSLRLVSRTFYIACMHVLRSSYLPAYDSLIRPPYTSDPFPLTSSAGTESTAPTDRLLPSLQRETAVLDLFIALKVREDVWMDDSELHLEREESFRDVFDLMQPRARCEDLVRAYGERAGVVGVGAAVKSGQVDFDGLSIVFSPRKVGLVLAAQGRKRTIVDVDRTRDEPLEVATRRLVRSLGDWVRG